MIELEQQAKQNARVLLYVLDTMTRNVVSMVETANYLGNRRNVIIAMNMYESTAQVVGSEKVTSE